MLPTLMISSHITQHQSCLQAPLAQQAGDGFVWSASQLMLEGARRKNIWVVRRYRAALDAALATEQVEIVANLLEELAARSGLGAALGEELLPALTSVIAQSRLCKVQHNVIHHQCGIDICCCEEQQLFTGRESLSHLGCMFHPKESRTAAIKHALGLP